MSVGPPVDLASSGKPNEMLLSGDDDHDGHEEGTKVRIAIYEVGRPCALYVQSSGTHKASTASNKHRKNTTKHR